jgi:hypothetical protein
MESENNLVPNNYLDLKNKEAKIKHPLENDNIGQKKTRVIEMAKENNENIKININNDNEKKDQNNSSAGNFLVFYNS